MAPAHSSPGAAAPSTARPTLWLVRPASAEGRHAPEFEYLTSWVNLQARRAFGAAFAVCSASPQEVAERIADDDRVLWLASERVLVARATLEGLARRLDADSPSSPGAAAIPLASLPDLERDPVYTLAGFERWEARELQVQRTETGEDLAVQAALLSASGFRSVLPDSREGAPASSSWEHLSLARVGVSHEFIDYYGEVRRDVLPHVPGNARRILEVGCGRGVTGELLRTEHGATVTGVELNPVVAREAADRLDRVVTGDIEDPDVTRRLQDLGPFDLVLALELFEHLARPEDFLLRAAELLAPEGAILLSTPNVGHYSVVEDLLAGRWDYLPVGLLCYTHLRFFTRRTLEDWLGRLGFEHFRLIPQITEPSPRMEALEQALAQNATSGSEPLLELDRDSLRTRGFFVLIERKGMIGDQERRMNREKRHDP